MLKLVNLINIISRFKKNYGGGLSQSILSANKTWEDKIQNKCNSKDR
jgi:hypothetical protein